jgi:hypothetical protein
MPKETTDDSGRTSRLSEALDDTTTESPCFSESDCELEKIAEDEANLAAMLSGGMFGA